MKHVNVCAELFIVAVAATRSKHCAWRVSRRDK
jgi:hypothetical protein